MPSTAADLKEVLNEAGKMLKALTAAQAKSLRTTSTSEQPGSCGPEDVSKGNAHDEECMGLLDSGASHPLRMAKDSELSDCAKVVVTLAGRQTDPGPKPVWHHPCP